MCFYFDISPLVVRYITICYDTAYGKKGIAKQKNRIDGCALCPCRRPRYAAASPRYDPARSERIDYDHAYPGFARRHAVGRRVGSRFGDRRRHGFRRIQFDPCGDNAYRRARSAFYQSRRFGLAAAAWLLWRLLSLVPHLPKTLSAALAAFISTLLHTCFVVGALYIFAGGRMMSAMGGKGFIAVLLLLLPNALLEAAAAAIVCAAVIASATAAAGKKSKLSQEDKN